MGVRLYCGVSETSWNGISPRPGKYACVAPVYGRERKVRPSVYIPPGSRVILDSGAFSDASHERLSFAAALSRQIDHAVTQGYWDKVELVATYDLLIDEMWDGNEREKRRWGEAEAWDAVETTINAAAFLNSNRHCLQGKGVVMSAQGVTPDQYLECAAAIVPFVSDVDTFGMGGWCISGLMPKKMLPAFSATISRLIPMLGQEGIRRVHIWGVIDSEFLGQLLWMCDAHGILLSTDSSGPHMRPARNGQWGYKGWINANYQRVEPRLRGRDRAVHVALTRCWLEHGLRQSAFYRPPSDRRLSRREYRGERE